MNLAMIVGTAILAGFAGYIMGEQARWTLALAFLGSNHAYIVIRVLR